MDETIFRAINNFPKEHPWLDPIAIFTAKYMVILLVIALIFFWFVRKRNNRVMIISAVLTYELAYISGHLLGLLYQHHQPFAELPNVHQLIPHDIDNCFPSDHTVLFFAFSTSFWLFKRKVHFLWIILALLVGVSRIVVGVHYPIDVLVGAIVGGVWAYLGYLFLPRWSFLHKLLDWYEGIEEKVWPKKS